MIFNLVIIAVLQLATAFCETFQAFLGVRALFGIGMGGIWGLSASMALESELESILLCGGVPKCPVESSAVFSASPLAAHSNCSGPVAYYICTNETTDMPMEARGLFSGILQQGYALGYLIAAGFNMGIVPNSKHSFKMLYYLGAGLTLAVAIARCFFAESKQFIEAKRHSEVTGKVKVKLFMADVRKILKEYWKRMVYAVILMALFNYVSISGHFLIRPLLTKI
jgi:SHS family lactate transporter-like MFS transporter